MNKLTKALNRPADAFREGSMVLSWVLVAVTALINSVFEPLLRHFCAQRPIILNFLSMLKITAYGLLSYIVICAVFFMVCKIFGSTKSFLAHMKAWGMTYFPTAVCAATVAVTEVFFYLFWNSTGLGMLLNFIFVAILIWKAILYIIYLREFAGLHGWRFAAAFIIIGIIILVMASISGWLGLKCPVI